MFLKLLFIGFFTFSIVEVVYLLENKPTSCDSLLRHYADTLKEFLTCSMHHAVPVDICIPCVGIYSNLSLQYDALIKAEIKEGNRTVKCREKYIDQDRLNIVLRNHDHFTSLWNEGSCFDCFYENTTLETNETAEMFNKFAGLTDCFNIQKNPCLSCNILYNEANSFFNDKFVKNHKEQICFDLHDRMNRTRSLWSKTFKCCKREANFGPFFGLASVVTCLPVLFYILAYFRTKYLENNDYTGNNYEANTVQEHISPVESESQAGPDGDKAVRPGMSAADNLQVNNEVKPSTSKATKSKDNKTKKEMEKALSKNKSKKESNSDVDDAVINNKNIDTEEKTDSLIIL